MKSDHSLEARVIPQIEKVVTQLKEGWAREQLRQAVRFYGSESTLDDLCKSRILRGNKNPSPELLKNSIAALKKMSLDIMKSILSIASTHLYDSFHIGSKNIVVYCKIGLGWGDYFSMWLSAVNLKEQIPEANVAVCANLQNRGTPPPLWNFHQNIEDWSFTTPEQATQVEERLKEVDLIVIHPRGKIPNLAEKPTLRIREMGYHPKDDFALGLSPMSTKIIGIPKRSVSSLPSLERLSHPGLKSKLACHPYYLGYLKGSSTNELHRAGFVVAALASHPDPSQDITIVCSLENMNWLSKEALQSLNVSRVVLSKGDSIEDQVLSIRPSGREVYIYDPFPISNEDWMLLLKFCEPLVGCTGDMTFIEVLANRKIPFYQILHHKRQFFESLQELAGYVYREDFAKLHPFLSLLSNSLQEDVKVVDLSSACQEIGAMCNAALLEEWRHFAEIIETRYAFDIANLVRRTWAFREHPDLKILETALTQRWYEGHITLEEACTIIAKNLYPPL